MDVSRNLLLENLKKCMPGVDTGSALLEGADTFIFSDNKVYTYNDNISVTVPLGPLVIKPEEGQEDEKLEGAVKAKEFFNLINKMKGDIVKILSTDDKWIIKSGKAKAELTLLNSKNEKSLMDFSIMETIKNITDNLEWKKLPENFKIGLNVCKFGCNRSPLSGIFVNGSVMCSTDQLRINYFGLSEEMEIFWLSDPTAGELMKFKGLETYSIKDQWVNFKTENEITFSCKRLNHKEYPFDKIIKIVKDYSPGEGDSVNELPLGLGEAVNRASSLSMDVDSREAIKLTFTEERIEVYSQRSSGKYTEKVPWPDKPEGIEETSVYLDTEMISYGLGRTNRFCIKQTEKTGRLLTRLVFAGDNFVHIISTLGK